MSDGLIPQEEWAETEIHKRSTYSCAKCGKQMESPEDFYRHLDEVHGKDDDDDD